MSRSSPPRRLLLALCAAAALVAPSAAAADEGPVDGRPHLDLRDRDAAAVPAPVAAARRALDARLGALGHVDTAAATGGVADVRRADGFLTGPDPRDAAEIALAYVRARPAVFGLDADDLDALRLQSRSVSPDGLTTLRWVQTVDGIASLDTGLVAHLAREGQLIAIGGGARADLTFRRTGALLDPDDAYRRALADAGAPPATPRADTAPGPEQATTFADGGTAQLAVLPEASGGRLVWRTVAFDDDGHGYEQAIDARDGSVRLRRPLTAHERHAEVYPRFPGAATGGAPTRVDLDADPAWLADDAGGTRLRGVNTHAYTERTPNNAVDPGEDVAAGPGGDWVRPLTSVTSSNGPCPAAPAFCTWDSGNTASLDINGDASAVNLFFHVNRFHDHLLAAPVGFDAASGNFERGDLVLAENDDRSGYDNANFATPPDGTSPRMQMFARRAAFDVNGSLSAETVYHEYTHGLTNRLVVGAGGSSTLVGEQARSMGEGWSDWFALDLLEARGNAVDGPAVGDLSYGAYWNGVGVRAQAIDCPVDVVAPRCAGGGRSYGDVRTLTAPHTSGEMWSQTLWDLRNAIGSAEARRLVTGGLRLSAPDPTFLDMRDAILAADLATGGAHRFVLWRTFAARGMGVSATSATTGVASATEAFDTPLPTVEDDPPVRELRGDLDGVAEPGETVEVAPRLRNTSAGPLAALAAEVRSDTAGVSVDAGAVGWPALAASLASAASPSPVRVTVGDDVRCGTPVRLRADAPGGPALPFRLRLGRGDAPSPTTWLSDAAVRPIPDGSGAGVTATIEVPGPGVPVQDLDLRLDGLDHGWTGDLRVLLQHDDGPRITLVDHPGRGDAGPGDLGGVLLDDEATASLASTTTPSAGRYRPTSPLSRYDGETTAGTWRLTVIDPWAGGTGTLRGWSLGFTEQGGCADNTARASTAPATDVATDGATLRASVDAADVSTQWRFAYGTTTEYGATTEPSPADATAGETVRTARLTGLEPGTTYHYRVEALRFGSVVARGADLTFTTAVVPPADPGPGPPETPPTGEAPPVAAPPAAVPPVLAPPPVVAPSRPARPALSLAGTPARLAVRSGRVSVPFAAPSGARGTLTLRAGGRTLGTARFVAPRTGGARVVVRLTAGGRAALRRARRHELVAVLTVRAGTERAVRRVRLRG
jgi:hypothetical protein